MFSPSVLFSFPSLRFLGISLLQFSDMCRYYGIYRYHGIPFHTGTESNTTIPVFDFITVNSNILSNFNHNNLIIEYLGGVRRGVKCLP